jgi:hypothetical protein
MGFSNITANDVVAEQVCKMLKMLHRSAERKGVECTLLLAATSLLLGQTSDRARTDLGDSGGKALEDQQARALAQELRREIRPAAIAWMGRWSECRYPRLESSTQAFGDWRVLKRYKSSASLGHEQYEVALNDSGKNLGAEMSKQRLLRIIRNAIAHGGVQWTTDPNDSRISGVSPITGVLFLNLTNPAKCEGCGQILVDREAIENGVAEYELIHAPIGGFFEFISDWARTLAEAKASHSAIESAVDRLGRTNATGAA